MPCSGSYGQNTDKSSKWSPPVSQRKRPSRAPRDDDLAQTPSPVFTSDKDKLFSPATREMVVDFRRPRPHPEPVIIKGETVWRWYTPTNTWECSWMTNWTGLPTQTLCAGKGQSHLYFLSFLQKLLQEAATDLLPVCGSERPPVRSSVLGGQPQEEGRSALGQTGEEGRLLSLAQSWTA
ncbi:hypothetical protein L3Q82_025064 [Scortum barcoo]|uniref:Uncharacterized protein n=1 Tax=Scortum barcoo TaxID=214431 RepID=A0ACB8WR27_9TELE|nr:hypothetical protein L3Q82_025064 [Scortum barcoo]